MSATIALNRGDFFSLSRFIDKQNYELLLGGIIAFWSPHSQISRLFVISQHALIEGFEIVSDRTRYGLQNLHCSIFLNSH